MRHGRTLRLLALVAATGITHPTALRAEVTHSPPAPSQAVSAPVAAVVESLGRRDFVKTAFRSTALALLRQPVTTYRLGKAMYWRRGRALLEDNLPVSLALPQETPPPPGSAAFELHLDRLGLPRTIPGDLAYFVGGASFFAELDAHIAAARKSIDVQVFIFDNDDVSVRYANLLRARAVDLPVRVLLDDLGSTFAHRRTPPGGLPPGFAAPDDIARHLTRDSTLQLRQTLNPWLVTDHTKLFLFDQTTAFLGGMNVGRESRHEWHDLMVGVRGPVVAALAELFDHTWERTGPRGDLALLDRRPSLPDPPDPLEGGVPLRILRTDAAEGRSEILLAMQQALRGATRRIWIETPYFASDTISRELQAAARRGVDVRVILPQRANHTIMDAGNFATATGLLNAGVKVFHYPGMTHLKAMLCDDWATVGAANLDTISLLINRELNLSFSDPDLVDQLARDVFSRDFAASAPLALEDSRRPLAPLIETIADQL